MSAVRNGELRLDLEPIVQAMAEQQAGVLGRALDQCPPVAVAYVKEQLLGALVAGLPVLLEQLQAAGWRAPQPSPRPPAP